MGTMVYPLTRAANAFLIIYEAIPGPFRAFIEFTALGFTFLRILYLFVDN